MVESSGYVTVYRSADEDAEADANSIFDRLLEGGFHPVVAGDDQPGVVTGTCEVRVPAAEAAAAERAVAAAEQEDAGQEDAVEGDRSHALDLAPVFRSQTASAEMEAISIRSLLIASRIPAIVVGTHQFPVLPFEVRVPASYLEEAQRIIAEAQQAGSQAAEEAEATTE
ncbi:MAG: hypothetical protein ACRD8O_07645 [Bryobacteraceae bacterium]